MSAEKVKFSTQVDAEIAAAVRSTVAALQRIVGPTVSLSSFVTEALVDAIGAAERRHNKGRPFTAVDHKLPTGPRITVDESTVESTRAADESTRRRRRGQVDQAVHSNEMEGRPTTAAFRTDAEEYVAGEIDADNLVDRTRARYGLD